MTTPVPIDERSRLSLAPGVLLRHDRTRGEWMLLGPERVLVLDDTALAVVQACIGADHTVAGGIDRIAGSFDAPRSEIAGDVIELLQDIRSRGFLAP